MQRLLDILLSGLALLVLSPLLVPIAIALRLTGEGEVFFEETIQSSPFISIHHEEFHSESVSLCPGDSRQTYRNRSAIFRNLQFERKVVSVDEAV